MGTTGTIGIMSYPTQPLQVVKSLGDLKVFLPAKVWIH